MGWMKQMWPWRRKPATDGSEVHVLVQVDFDVATHGIAVTDYFTEITVLGAYADRSGAEAERGRLEAAGAHANRRFTVQAARLV